MSTSSSFCSMHILIEHQEHRSCACTERQPMSLLFQHHSRTLLVAYYSKNYAGMIHPSLYTCTCTCTYMCTSHIWSNGTQLIFNSVSDSYRFRCIIVIRVWIMSISLPTTEEVGHNRVQKLLLISNYDIPHILPLTFFYWVYSCQTIYSKLCVCLTPPMPR